MICTVPPCKRIFLGRFSRRQWTVKRHFYPRCQKSPRELKNVKMVPFGPVFDRFCGCHRRRTRHKLMLAIYKTSFYRHRFYSCYRRRSRSKKRVINRFIKSVFRMCLGGRDFSKNAFSSLFASILQLLPAERPTEICNMLQKVVILDTFMVKKTPSHCHLKTGSKKWLLTKKKSAPREKGHFGPPELRTFLPTFSCGKNPETSHGQRFDSPVIPLFSWGVYRGGVPGGRATRNRLFMTLVLWHKSRHLRRWQPWNR